jgi:hypothetical protein
MDVGVVLDGYLFHLSHSLTMVGLFRLTGELRLQVLSSLYVYGMARRVGRVSQGMWRRTVGPPG